MRHHTDELDLFNALDKGNLGNAETDNMSKGKTQFEYSQSSTN